MQLSLSLSATIITSSYQLYYDIRYAVCMHAARITILSYSNLPPCWLLVAGTTRGVLFSFLAAVTTISQND
jgi:hypothetical protein